MISSSSGRSSITADAGRSHILAYHAYGLSIRSALELPELTRLDDNKAIDVEIAFSAVDGPLPGPDVARVVRIERNHAYLAWPRIGRFLVTRQGQVTIDPLTDQSLAIRFAILGPVMAAYLQLNGIPLLHGSAVAIDGRAILCIGRKTAGKSTMAAALVAAGCTLLNDDVLPLRIGVVPALTPGFPALKLSSSARALLLPDRPIIGDQSADPADKLVVALPGAPTGDIAIGLVVLLDPDGLSGIATVSPVEALGALLQEGYSLKFGDHALEAGQGSLLFDSCARIASQCRIVRAGRSHDLAGIPMVADQLRALARSE